MYEHLRGGLRNQIPKFEIDASFPQFINPYITQGSGIQSPYNPQPISTNPQPNLNVNLTDYIQQDQKRQQQEYEAKLFSTPASDGDNTGGSGKSKINQLLNKGLNSTRDYLVQNAGQIANFGLNATNSWATSGVEQDGFMNGVNGASNFIRNIPGIGEKASMLLGTVTTGLNVINKLGGSYVSKYQADQNLMANMGSSYGGLSDLAQRAADATGKTYGLFNGGGKRRAKRLKNEAIRQENIVSDINSTAQDQFAMTGNDLNYTRYQFNQNGGWDQALMRVAKLGAKLESQDEVFPEDNWEPQLFKDGGSIEDDIFSEDSWEPQITELKEGGNLSDKQNETEEETNQKNIIPEGALHKEKHHMENAEDLTKKGIPVIDNDGVQQAEIERDEIVFTLEVTKKLEDLYHKYYDQETSKKDDLAIEAGKILVYEILYNTLDRTGLISKCKEGGKLNET